MFDRTQFRRGQDVYDRDNNKIGSVSDVGPNYIRVPTGFLGLGQDLYIPFSAVDRADDGSIFMNVTKDQISSRGWTHPPTAEGTTTGTAGREMYGTMPAAGAAAATRTIAPEDARGHSMCDVNGKKIGDISGVGPHYFHVVTGLLGLGNDLFVPIDEVGHCSKDCCYLNIGYDAIQSRNWNQRPEEEMAAGRPPAEAVRSEMRPEPEHAGRTYRIPLREEEIEVHRHREQVGEVIVSKDVVSEQRTIDVPVTREEVRIERRAFHGQPGEVPPGSQEGEIRVPVYEERVDVDTRNVVREEIVVEPEEVTRREQVTRTVRHEVPHVKTTGEAGEYVEGEENIEGRTAERTAEQRAADERAAETEQKQRRVGE